jgi:hypothetical protein
MTGKIMPLRERDTGTVQAAADAFLSSPRYANPNTCRGYTGVLDRLLAGLGASRPLAEVSGEELAGQRRTAPRAPQRHPRGASPGDRPGADSSVLEEQHGRIDGVYSNSQIAIKTCPACCGQRVGREHPQWGLV